MHNFKIGDKVRCVSAWGDLALTVGKTYEVKRADSDFLNVVEDDDGKSGEYFPHRFELVPEQKQKAPRDYVADHARRTLRKAGLSREEAAALVRNWAHETVQLSQLSRKLPDTLSAIILGAFVWDTSTEGFECWSNICYREFKKEQNAQTQP